MGEEAAPKSHQPEKQILPKKNPSGALSPRAPTRLTASLESSPLPPLRCPLVQLLLTPPPRRVGPITGQAAPRPPLGVAPLGGRRRARGEPGARAWNEVRGGQRRLVPHATRTAHPCRLPERSARARPTPTANGAPSGHDRRRDEGDRKRGAVGAPASRRSGHQPQAGRGRAQGERGPRRPRLETRGPQAGGTGGGWGNLPSQCGLRA